MSYSKEVTLWCDGQRDGYACGNWTNGGGQMRTVKEVRQYAKSQGWDVGLPGGKDYCPECSA